MTALATPKSSPTELDRLSEELLESYLGDERARRISRRYLPSREAIAEILQGVLDLMYPGYFGRRDLSSENLGASRRTIARGAGAENRTRDGTLLVLRARARSRHGPSSASARPARTI